jgi:hypothetical protein
MAQALNHIEKAVEHSSRGVRLAIAFGIVAAGYGLVVASGVIA